MSILTNNHINAHPQEPTSPPTPVQRQDDIAKGHNHVLAGSFTVRIPGYYSCGLSTYSNAQLNIITRTHGHVGGVCAAMVELTSHTNTPASCSALVRLNIGEEAFVMAQQSGNAFAPWVPQRSDGRHFVLPYTTFHCNIIKAIPH